MTMLIMLIEMASILLPYSKLYGHIWSIIGLGNPLC